MIDKHDDEKCNKDLNNREQSSQGFLAQKDRTVEKAPQEPYQQSHTGKSFPLAMASQGENLKIVKLKGSEGTVRRLIAMGLVPGTEVQLINIVGGSVILAIGDNRIGLGVGMAQRVICMEQFD